MNLFLNTAINSEAAPLPLPNSAMNSEVVCHELRCAIAVTNTLPWTPKLRHCRYQYSAMNSAAPLPLPILEPAPDCEQVAVTYERSRQHCGSTGSMFPTLFYNCLLSFESLDAPLARTQELCVLSIAAAGVCSEWCPSPHSHPGQGAPPSLLQEFVVSGAVSPFPL